MNDDAPPVKSPEARYIEKLYKLGAMLGSGNARLVSEARRDLALLRRGHVGKNQFGAYSVLLRNEDLGSVRDEELEAWLLVGNLFALHPLIAREDRGKSRSFGAAVGVLRSRLSSSASVDRRMDQLLSLERHSLPHYLRQMVRLLSANNIAVNYAQLLDDLLVLLGPPRRVEQVAKVRLRWAREYHMPVLPPRIDADPATAEAPESPEKSQ